MEEKTAARSLALAAGLFEAKGTICREGAHGRRIRASVVFHERDVLDQFTKAVEVGSVYGPYEHSYPDGHRRRERFIWQVTDVVAETAMRRLWPWLSARKRQRIQKALHAT